MVKETKTQTKIKIKNITQDGTEKKSKQQKNMIGIYKNMYIYLEGELMKEFLYSINIKYIVTGGL